MNLKSYIWFLSQPPLPVLMLVSTLAWLLLWFGGHDHAAHQMQSATMEQQMHQHHHSAIQVEPLASPMNTLRSEMAQMSGWAIMMLAMMFPLLHNAIRHIWRRSLPRIRLLGSALFCTGYLAPWLLIGYLCNSLLRFLQDLPSSQTICGMVLLVVFWQASPWKQWALNYCHYTQRLALSGGAYVYDCMLFGIKKGAWCIASCWHLMLFPMLFNSFILMFAAMFVVCIWMFVEQHMTPRVSKWRLPFWIGNKGWV